LKVKRLEETDHQVHRAIQAEITRERNNLLMIASENYASESVIEAQANVMTNKYANMSMKLKYWLLNVARDYLERNM